MLTKENKKAIVEQLDDLIKLNGVLEIVDGVALNLAIGYLDSGVLGKINVKYHEPINQAVTLALIEKKYPEAVDIVGNILAEAVDTPLIDGTVEEQETYDALLNVLYSIIIALLAKHGPSEDD